MIKVSNVDFFFREHQKHTRVITDTVIPNTNIFNINHIFLTQGVPAHWPTQPFTAINSELHVRFPPCYTGGLYCTVLPTFEERGVYLPIPLSGDVEK